MLIVQNVSILYIYKNIDAYIYIYKTQQCYICVEIALRMWTKSQCINLVFAKDRPCSRIEGGVLAIDLIWFQFLTN